MISQNLEDNKLHVRSSFVNELGELVHPNVYYSLVVAGEVVTASATERSERVEFAVYMAHTRTWRYRKNNKINRFLS